MIRHARRWAAPLAAILLVAPTLAAQTRTPRARSGQDSLRVLQFVGDRGVLQLQIDSLTRLIYLQPLDSAARVQLSRRANELVVQMARLISLQARMESRQHDEAMRAAQNLESGFAAEQMARDMATAWQVGAPVPRANARGWIGLNVEAPHVQTMSRNGEVYVRYFDYPAVVSVEPNSPAEKAGVQTGEVLVAFDGRDVRDNDINVTRLLRPAARIAVTLRRATPDGETTRVIPMTVASSPDHVLVRRQSLAALPPEAMATMPAMAPMPPMRDMSDMPDAPEAPAPVRVYGGVTRGAPTPRPSVFTLSEPDAIAGAKLVTLNPDLGRAFGVSRGVLVTEAASGSFAREAGLRAGDVIVAADGHRVTSVAQLRPFAERGVVLDVIRTRHPKKIVLQ